MAKRTKTKPAKKTWTVPAFLKELLDARSPSGFEDEAREVVRNREWRKRQTLSQSMPWVVAMPRLDLKVVPL